MSAEESHIRPSHPMTSGAFHARQDAHPANGRPVTRPDYSSLDSEISQIHDSPTRLAVGHPKCKRSEFPEAASDSHTMTSVRFDSPVRCSPRTCRPKSVTSSRDQHRSLANGTATDLESKLSQLALPTSPSRSPRRVAYLGDDEDHSRRALTRAELSPSPRLDEQRQAEHKSEALAELTDCYRGILTGTRGRPGQAGAAPDTGESGQGYALLYQGI